jgi:hypothetical protein
MLTRNSISTEQLSSLRLTGTPAHARAQRAHKLIGLNFDIRVCLIMIMPQQPSAAASTPMCQDSSSSQSHDTAALYRQSEAESTCTTWPLAAHASPDLALLCGEVDRTAPAPAAPAAAGSLSAVLPTRVMRRLPPGTGLTLPADSENSNIV